MKNLMRIYQSRVIILVIAIFGSLAAQAGEVTGTFSPGGTLTATQMNEIKDAVNDNDTRVGANTTAIGNNNTSIGTNTGDISTNSINIGINDSAITDHESRITDLEGASANLFSGDGSAGDLLISAPTSWVTNPPANPFFNNITIDAGQTLTVPAGTTIRCSGTFTNNGTLFVEPGAETKGAFSIAESSSSAPTWGLTSVAHPGDTARAATLGEYSNTAVNVNGGEPGGAIPEAVATTSYSNFRIGGGSGAGYDNQGARGGGLVKIYCTGAIVNAGVIDANGQSATNTSIAGGGGGIVILASRTSVDNSAGTISVTGGNSNNGSGSWGGNSGGGGGGIVIMASPVAPVLGTELVTGGLGGTDVVNTVSATIARTGGAGGGGSGGAGGRGGNVNAAGTRSLGSDGSDGYTLTFTYDPIYIAR